MTPVIRLTRDQVRLLDRLAIAEYGLSELTLMENAAAGVMNAAIEMLGAAADKQVLIVCGSGNNGGDGLAAGRMLLLREVQVHIALVDHPGKIKGDSAQANLQRAQDIRLIPIQATPRQIRETKADLLIDAMLGTGLSTAPRAEAFDFIDAMNANGAPILAVDLPSGLDCNTGRPLGTNCIRAAKTVTFVAEKAGFTNPDSKAYTGEVIVADIGTPIELTQRVIKT